VPRGQIFQDTDATYYFTPANYAKYQTTGVEIETNIYITSHLSVRGVGTFQKGKLDEYEVWVSTANGRADDTKKSYSGNEADNAPRVMLNITPTYTTNKFYTFLTWSYLGSRQANAANVFKLPSFSQFDFSAGYNITKAFQLSLNVNNLFNTYGVMTFIRPGSLSQFLGGNDGFSKAEYEAAVAANTPYNTVGIQPRAFYLTATVKF
jgi:outer membrane receptor protein involved in Fe transport